MTPYRSKEADIATTEPAPDARVDILWPVPSGKKARLIQRELAWTYRQFGQVIGPRGVREIVIADRVRPERVVAAFAGERLVGYLALRLDRQGPFSMTGRDFRAQFGLAWGTLRYLGFRLLERQERRDEIFIDGFIVSADAPGEGLGARLLAEGERIGRTAGKRVCRVRIRADAPEAAAFYAGCGFAREGASEISWVARLVGIGPVATYAKPL